MSGLNSSNIFFPSFNSGIPLTSGQKWMIAIVVGIIAAIIFSPFVYGLTNSLSTSLRGPTTYITPGGATLWGLFIHTVIFILIIRLLMF